MSRSFGAALLLLATGSVLPAQTPPRRFELADLSRLVQLREPQIAPDGKSIVLVVGRVNGEENRYDTDLVSVDLATRVTRRLTFERPGLASPRFSPAGDRLAFLADGPADGASPQVYVLSMAGGEARRVTSAPLGVSAFAWRPDGATLAFIAGDPPPATTPTSRRASRLRRAASCAGCWPRSGTPTRSAAAGRPRWTRRAGASP